jgi:hypothetical protein
MLIIVKLYERFWQRFSFNTAMKYWVLLGFIFFAGNVFAQDTIRGIVIDKVSKDRIAAVNIVNTTTGNSQYDNLKGQFNIAANIGDILIFTKADYKPDTLKIKDFDSRIIYLVPTARVLAEVHIRDTILNPQQKLLKTQQEYNTIYSGPLGHKDALTIGPDGAGIGIDALWNSISRSGRNAAHLRDNIQQDYYQNVIDYRFSRALVGKITGLKDGQLTDFMQKYRPGYFFVTTASDYEFIASIKANYKRYLRRPKAYNLPSLTQ